MQYIDFKTELNSKQYEAVTNPNRHIRIVAGAGSGKTRVLTYRIAFLISELNVEPWSILAITFTNKVADEMKKRVIKMIPEANKDLTIKTFHSFAAMFLRHEISVLNYPSSFSILDEEDQTKLVKDIAASRGYKRSDKIVGKTLSYIASNKLKEKYPEDIVIKSPSFEDEKECLEMYTIYEEEKNKILCLDFDDLLLKTNYILEHFPSIRTKWQNRINHILIDEFQDTNNVEYKMVRLLKRDDAFLYVVGDPDQTIYTWRGANQDIILKLNDNFRNLDTVVLEENYRSTPNILNCANCLISHNKLRVPKNLYTNRPSGKNVIAKSNSSIRDEAQFVAREIKRLVQIEGYSYEDIAILYRANYVTIDFENAFAAFNIPYVIYGGIKFYERREIKDVLAYFRLVINTKDDISFERIVNVPKRGIGDTTITRLKQEAKEHNLSLYEYVEIMSSDESEISSKNINSLKALTKRIDIARDDISKKEEVFSKILEDLIWSLGFVEYLQKEDDGDERIENVKALFSDLRHFLHNNPDSGFDEYLQNITLLSAQDDIIEGDHIKLMTAHTAKGLEFPVVFVVRLNEGVFPNQRALNEGSFKAMEEERRLAYVAMTRAMKMLYLTCAGDYSYVIGDKLIPSCFFKESGNELFQQEYNPFFSNNSSRKIKFNDGEHLTGFETKEVKPVKQDFSEKTNGLNESDFVVGDIVIHKTLGKGVVTCLEGDGIITVNFEEHGEKSIMCNHPSVTKGGK